MGGGAGTGKSTEAAALFAELKYQGYEYDILTEMARKIKAETDFGKCRSAYERFFFWEMQEREELNSVAQDGFITCTPLFQFYLQALFAAKEKRNQPAIARLHNKCIEIADRYAVIAIAEDPDETPYKRGPFRRSSKVRARKNHYLARSFCELHYPDRIVFVKGSPLERAKQIIAKLDELRARKHKRKKTKN